MFHQELIMPDNKFPHLKIEGFGERGSYTTPLRPRSRTNYSDKSRNVHGQFLRERITEISTQITQESVEDLPDDLIREDAVYLEFEVNENFNAFDSLDSERNYYRLLNIKKVDEIVGGGSGFSIAVLSTERGLSHFLQKINQFLDTSLDNENDIPRNKKLVQNIENIKKATVKSLWADHDRYFPETNTKTWWEIWIRRKNFLEDTNEDQKVIEQGSKVGISYNNQRLIFPEHLVRLAYATVEELASSLMYLDNIAELRKPHHASEFFTNEDVLEQADWIEELISRREIVRNDSNLFTCLLDTGVNNGHPLLSGIVTDDNMDSYDPQWGTADSMPNGHGTQMSSIILYGDLFEHLLSTNSVKTSISLESLKILQNGVVNSPNMYGHIVIQTIAKILIRHPERQRFFCMSITSDHYNYYGRPSSWSSTIDNLCSGNIFDSNEKYLFLVSAGNVLINNASEYSTKNLNTSIEDPAQSFNAITVGAFTQKDLINNQLFPLTQPLASYSGMSPHNSTSINWLRNWPQKPDVVFEGGNLGRDQAGNIINIDSLELLAANRNFATNNFSTFDGTSAAAALCSRFINTVYTDYPTLWPETIRALIIHSANWSEEMLSNRDISSFNSDEKKKLLRTFGYGVPNLDKALYSLSNSLTLIIEDELQPFDLKDGRTVTNEMRIFELPWPREILEELGNSEVILNVTLSYFIEPNPGNRIMSTKYNYQSHGLRFRSNNSTESKSEFKARLSSSERSEDYTRGNTENWALGPEARSSGSVHRDFWQGPAIELASRNLIGIHPVNGWFKTRKKLDKWNNRVRFSLVVTIESESIETDIYNYILNLVRVQNTITNNI